MTVGSRERGVSDYQPICLSDAESGAQHRRGGGAKNIQVPLLTGGRVVQQSETEMQAIANCLQSLHNDTH